MRDPSDTRPARGVIIGVVIGAIYWAIVLWLFT